MKSLISLLAISLSMTILAGWNAMGNESENDSDAKIYELTMKSLEGKSVDLSEYKGKVILAVNVASRCGYTPQYEGLQELFEKYQDKGLVILGFPCNQFGRQEPGTSEEIAEFCSSRYGVTFDMFEKIEVNGNDACDLYKYLTGLSLEPAGKGKISWNFEKFLIDRDGNVVARYKSGVAPGDKELVSKIESLLDNS